MRLRFLQTCYFCNALWGACSCEWSGDGFVWDGVWIVDPSVDDTGRFFVNPYAHYGAAYVDWQWKQLAMKQGALHAS